MIQCSKCGGEIEVTRYGKDKCGVCAMRALRACEDYRKREVARLAKLPASQRYAPCAGEPHSD